MPCGTCTRVCTCVCVCVCVCQGVSVTGSRMHALRYMQACVYLCLCVHACACVCGVCGVYMCVCVCVLLCMCFYIHLKSVRTSILEYLAPRHVPL